VPAVGVGSPHELQAALGHRFSGDTRPLHEPERIGSDQEASPPHVGAANPVFAGVCERQTGPQLPESLAPLGEGAEPGDVGGQRVDDEHHGAAIGEIREPLQRGQRDEARRWNQDGPVLASRCHQPFIAPLERLQLPVGDVVDGVAGRV
jgi:hypothetical protein